MKDCTRCRHLRTAPYQAKCTGCYHPTHLVGKQKDAYLDEQQMPGDHTQINRGGDCAEYEPLPGRLSLLRRLFSLGA